MGYPTLNDFSVLDYVLEEKRLMNEAPVTPSLSLETAPYDPLDPNSCERTVIEIDLPPSPSAPSTTPTASAPVTTPTSTGGSTPTPSIPT